MWLQVLKLLLFFAKQPTDIPTDAPSFAPTSGEPTSEPTEVDIGLLEDGTFNCTSPAISKNDCKNAPYCEWDKNSCFDVTPEPTTSPSETPTKFPSELPTSSPLSSPPTLRPSELPTSSQVKDYPFIVTTLFFSFYIDLLTNTQHNSFRPFYGTAHRKTNDSNGDPNEATF